MSDEESYFKAGLFDCFDDINICLCSFCCPCIQFGRNVENLHKYGDDDIKEFTPFYNRWHNCALFTCLLFPIPCIYPLFCLPRIGYQYYIRSLHRGNDYVDEWCDPDHTSEIVNDIFVSSCCWCCAIAQEAKQFKEDVEKEDTEKNDDENKPPVEIVRN